jgi:SNF2 family DNA or RNA helicase
VNQPLPLFPYQDVGARFLAGKERAGLFDEMGVGKSAQAIGALDYIGATRVMIVCPAAVREVWAGEFKKFARIRRKVIKAKSIHDLGMWLKGRADVLLCSYEMAAKWGPKIEGDIIDALVFDESQYLKSPDSQRTRAMLGTHCDGVSGLARFAAHAWFLSGTPMPNDPVDIWPWLRFCGGTSMNLRPFTDRYFKSWQGAFSSKQEPRDEMVGELRQAIRAFSLRRTQKDAGLALPPVFLTTTTVDGDTEEIRQLLRDFPGLESAILDAIEEGGLSFLDAQHVATLRRLVGEAKAPAYAQLLVEELHNGKDKQVIFGMHTKAASIIQDYLVGHGFKGVSITGATSEKDRVEAVRAFQHDADCRWFYGNIKAAGTGTTLTAAAHIDLFESSWAPADNAQALFRVCRIGQKRSVRGRFISLARSIDEVVSETVARKTAAITKVEE